MSNLMRKAGTILGATTLILTSLVATTATTAVAAPQQRQVTSAVALRVTCTDHDRRGIRYTTGSGYRVGARCESKRWAAFSGSGLGALTAAMCTVVAALGSPVGGALCVTIVAATAVTLWVIVREVRNNGRCFGVIRDWRMGAPLILSFACRYERPPGSPRVVS